MPAPKTRAIKIAARDIRVGDWIAEASNRVQVTGVHLDLTGTGLVDITFAVGRDICVAADKSIEIFR